MKRWWATSEVTDREQGGVSRLAPVLAAGGAWLAELLQKTETRLEAIASEQRSPIGGYVRATLAAGGKRLRPLLVFLSAGDGGAEHGLVRAGAAVELLHMATLVHDDVLDRATLRRGRSTVYNEGGRSAATASGDVMFSRAFGELVATQSKEAVRVLSGASSSLARGELMQRADAWSHSITVERYLKRCELKTARLFEAACKLGAIFAEPARRAADALGEFGLRLGLAFQIYDDVLDVAGSSDHTGKGRGVDLLDGTVTLPLLLARELAPNPATLDIKTVADSPERAHELCELIAATGALEQARRHADRYLRDATAALAKTHLSSEHKQRLELVVDQVASQYG